MPPPLPCLLGIVLGLICDWLWPWPLAPSEYLLPVGVVLVGLVGVCMVTLARAFSRHKTSANPYKDATAVVDTGPFRFSRNPGYLTLAMLQAALGVLLNNVWVLLLIVPAFIVIHHVVVLGEEAYLEATFGDAYLDYKSRVRRWI